MNKSLVLHNNEWLDLQIEAGRCISKILKRCGDMISSSPYLSLIDLEKEALSILSQFNCKPTFLNFGGFPNAICTSVNNVVAHGVVSDYTLKSGDIISVDVGATFQGAIADAARTWIYGEAKEEIHIELLDVCKKALQFGQDSVMVGNRTGMIGYNINKYVSSCNSNGKKFSLITDYGGHGMTWNDPHTVPFIANFDFPNNGVEIVNGLVIAIEPMLTLGGPRTKVSSDDKFSIMCNDLSAHFENSVTVMNDCVYIITEDLDEEV
jgi:methionyl aminopeptidase